MGLRGKLSAEIEIKSSPDNYFKRLKEELHHLPDAASGVHGVEVHEGDFKTHGSIKSWSYTLDGKKETFKERFEIDEAEKTVSMVAVGGHILERYKSYTLILSRRPAMASLTWLESPWGTKSTGRLMSIHTRSWSS